MYDQTDNLLSALEGLYCSAVNDTIDYYYYNNHITNVYSPLRDLLP